MRRSEITTSHKTGFSLLNAWEWGRCDTPEESFWEQFETTQAIILDRSNNFTFEYLGIALDLSNNNKIVGSCAVETIPMCEKQTKTDTPGTIPVQQTSGWQYRYMCRELQVLYDICFPREQIKNTAVNCDSKYIEFCDIFSCYFCCFLLFFAQTYTTHTRTITEMRV